jgi:putative hemolysin
VSTGTAATLSEDLGRRSSKSHAGGGRNVILFLELLGVAALILLNAYFVAAEYALVTARRTKIQELADQGSRRARAVQQIVSDPPHFIAAMQLGVTLASLGIGALGEQALAHALEPALATVLAVAIAFLIITYLHVVIGELVPKGAALRYSERIALAVSTPVRAFFFVFNPLIWFLEWSSEATMRALGFEPPRGDEGEALSEAELRMLLGRATEHGEIEREEQEMLYKVFDFADKEVADVMVPRPEVVALSIDLPPEECLAAVIESPYTRYPVYRETLDNIIGVLHVRDLFSALNDQGFANVRIEELLREPYIVPETKDLASLLADFRRESFHMAVVVDEYGTMAGIVTLEDLLEEIVGEIEDEFDLPDESVERVDEKTIRIDGTFPIDDFNERFRVEIPIEDYHTVAGFVFGLLGRAPSDGDDVAYDGLHFRVVEIEGSRIEKLEVTFVEPAQREQDEPHEERAAAEG